MTSGNPWVIAIATALIISASAFFVAVEFALMAAKRHRLEDAALTSRSARAALRSASELTLLLAGSQLGITVCTLGLGAITEPAVHHWLAPMLDGLGLSEVLADILAFVLALLVVTFLHLVVGEMAPKSWAISHPERSATMLALPMRGFMWVFRPLLRMLNGSANWLVRKVGVEPTDQIGSSQNPADLRQLVEHSVNVGALDARYAPRIGGALEMQTLTAADVVESNLPPTLVSDDASVGDVRSASRRSGHLRILVGQLEGVRGVIHVRDTLTHPDVAPAASFVRPAFVIESTLTLHAALAQMRQTQNHFAIVTNDGKPCAVITLADILQRLFPSPSADEDAASTLRG